LRLSYSGWVLRPGDNNFDHPTPIATKLDTHPK
jgi:hypothetical protein